ncbi:cob(I)yrinic acid a,c-diamide adenosyltransferase [Candidatus Peregrinibacteria bacterium]|nr:cob(I)yrinic acid a,c-diamide adenosyltransferase [Candidatus Peregrinibacteria bacterium]
MSHIYTKSGDKGQTGLLGEKRVSKNSLRIRAIGNLDELNAALGVLLTLNPLKKAAEILWQIQDDIFTIGAEIADPEKKYVDKRIDASRTKLLEKNIDELEAKLPRLKNFILPGGTSFSSHAHLARAICRRAERCIVRLNEKENLQNEQIVIYLNRLSDLLFMLARQDNFEKRVKEIPWKSK